MSTTNRTNQHRHRQPREPAKKSSNKEDKTAATPSRFKPRAVQPLCQKQEQSMRKGQGAQRVQCRCRCQTPWHDGAFPDTRNQPGRLKLWCKGRVADGGAWVQGHRQGGQCSGRRAWPKSFSRPPKTVTGLVPETSVDGQGMRRETT